MKRTEQLYRTAVLLTLLMLAAACTPDDAFDNAAPGNGTDPAAVLTIIVTDGAYAPEASAANAATDNGAPVTRAVENGFATGFTAGDQIGLYVADAKVYGPGNLNDLRITASISASPTMAPDGRSPPIPSWNTIPPKGATSSTLPIIPIRRI